MLMRKVRVLHESVDLTLNQVTFRLLQLEVLELRHLVVNEHRVLALQLDLFFTLQLLHTQKESFLLEIALLLL